MPSVSVIVPIRNESRSIERTLRSLLTQDYPSDQFEVIVADGFSTDNTVAIVRELQGEFPNLQLVYNPKRFSSAARNAAIRHMHGDFAVVIDGHCHIPDQGYIRNLVEAFTLSEADSLGRPQPLAVPEPTEFQSAVSLARSSKLGHNPDSDIYSNEAKFVEPQNTAIAYRRSVFHRVGFFDERFDACEDVEFNHRVYEADLTCYFTPKLTIVYHPRTELRGLFTQLARYGCGRARLARKHLRSLTLPALVPPAWIVWVALGPLLMLILPELAWLYAGSILFYLSVVIGMSLHLGRRHPWNVAVRIPGIFLGIHAGFAYGFLREATQAVRSSLRRIR